ncbi:MAG: hypothetical protein C4K60_19005 [Ideonella sp. MAG2]|nr:MAG: hypothetical protein C4K60_19005 [Ideonella sp. MAG2]
MDFTIASILALDGVTNGAVYALLALATVLVFTVTRVIFIPQGEFVTFGALTLAVLQTGKTPGTVWFLLALAVLVALMDAVAGLRGGRPQGEVVKSVLKTLALPVVLAVLVPWAAPQQLPLSIQAAMTLAIVTPMGGLIYRVAYESLADASVLVLLIVSVGVHIALTGLGLVFFGAEGSRNPSFWDERFNVGVLAISGQALIMFAASGALILALYLFFERSLWGKALRRGGTLMRRQWILPLFCAAMLLLPALPVPDFWITQLNYIGLSAIVSLGLVVLTGVAGLTSFGQAAFVGVGAYTSAYLSVTLGISPWLTLFVGLALSVLVAVVLGALTLRMSGHYLPLATIAWGLALNYSMANMEFLGKYDGILGVPPLMIGDMSLGSGRAIYVLIWLVALGSAIAVINLLDSRPGRAIRSLKNGTTMAEAMGISTFRYKMVAFVLAAILAALSGWLFAHFQRTVNPSPFSLSKGIEVLFMAVLGGIGHVWGAFLGSGMVKLLEDQLQVLLPKLLGGSGNYETIVFGVILVLVLKYAPDGLWTFVQRWFPKPPRDRDWEGAEALPSRSKPSMGEPLLEARAVRKEFGGLVAVNDVSFTIRAGDIMGDHITVMEFGTKLISGTPAEVQASPVVRAAYLGTEH